MDKKISRVLKRLENKSNYEEKNFDRIPHDERMLAITKDTGIFYNTILRMQKPKRILEIGTSTGYSSLWFADAVLGLKTEILTIEQSQKKIDMATRNFKSAGVSKIIQIKQGNAKDVLNQMLKEFRKNKSRKYFDFVFIDADKEEYGFYFEASLKMLKRGGIIAADNIIYPKRFQTYIKKYMDYVYAKKNIQTSIIPIGNGQQISIKIK
ncbi:MAG: O-methyltransferase [Nitrosopumilus sp.]|jgi:predicted O-methyltransferase YrrM|nr:O-methyltransferase [Nitrosopumilus sp.]